MWTLGNKWSVKESFFRSEEPTIKGSSEKRGQGQVRTPADGGGNEFADVRNPALFIIIVVCFTEALCL